MRKQTKLVAVLSASALLAIGASMTSFAAAGRWAEENGTWVCYDRDGDRITEEWQKSGNYWYWLNEDGEMATSTLIEDDNNYYYVNEDGIMVQNRWISIENEDYDSDDEGSPENYWYYFGSNGRAFKRGSSATTASFKTINGKKYIFDDEGHMLYGWINEEGEQETDDATKWQEGKYYCGGENDGAQKSGEWAYLDIVDEDFEEALGNTSSPNVFDDENQTRWFYFNTNGKKYENTTKTINGRKYQFDKYGRMNVEWVLYTDSSTSYATPSTAQAASKTGNKDYTSQYRYYGDPENGARKTKGWFQVVPDQYVDNGKFNDDEDAWYYSDNSGNLVAGEIKTINGKKYAFNNKGAMQTGLKVIKDLGANGLEVYSLDSSSLPYGMLDTEDDFRDNIPTYYANGFVLYYFGGSDDGSMKTGRQTVTIDGENFSFLFIDSGTKKGQGKFGIDSKKYYLGGMLMAADREDKYSIFKIEYSDTSKSSTAISGVTKLSTDDFLDEMRSAGKLVTEAADDKYEVYYKITSGADGSVVSYKLVNTAGNVQKGKNKAKDGDDYCFVVDKNEQITAVYVED